MKKKNLILAGAFLFAANVLGQTPYIPHAMNLSKGGTDFSFGFDYFVTQQVVNDEGEAANINDADDSAAYSKMDFDFIGKYGITDKLEISAGVRARYIQTAFQADYGSGVEEYSLTTSGLESYFVGAKFGLKSVERIKFGLEGYYRMPTYSNLEYTGGEPEEVAFGEGSREYGLGLNFMFKTRSNNVFEAKGVYRSPGEEMAHEIFTDLRYALVFENLSLYLGAENVLSLGNDPYTDDKSKKPAVFQGWSKQFNSINRQWFAPFLGLNFAMGKSWRLGFQGKMVASGRSTDLGPGVLITLGKRSEVKNSKFEKKNNAFKQYRAEGVVRKLSKSRKVAIIDKGKKDGLRKGMTVDFFDFNFVGGNKLIATGRIIKIKYSKALVKIRKRYSRKRVKKGTVVRIDEIRD